MKTEGKIWIIYNAESKVQSKPMSVVQAQVILLNLDSAEQEKYFLWTPGWQKWICVEDFLKSNQNFFVLHQPPAPDEIPYVSENTKTIKTEDATIRSKSTDGDKNTTTALTDPHYQYTKVNTEDEPIKKHDHNQRGASDFNGDDLDLSKIRKITSENNPFLENAHQIFEETNGLDRRKDPRLNFKIEVLIMAKNKTLRTYSKNMSLSGALLEDEIPKDFFNSQLELIIVNPFEQDQSKSRLHFKSKVVGDLRDPRRLVFIEQDQKMTQRLQALLKAYVSYQKQMRKSAG